MAGTRALVDATAPRRSSHRLVLAVGGNALTSARRSTIEDEFTSAGPLARVVAELVAGGAQVTVTHGNGPQVGFILRRSELTAHLAEGLPELPLEYCVAETQGGLGYVLANRIGGVLRERGMRPAVAALMTQTVVSADDPAFTRPSKPVGHFYSAAEADRLRAGGWPLVEDAGRGYRRVVPSPDPLSVVESPAVVALLEAGFVVIAAGGGGVPVVRNDSGRLQGIAAVIDKDLASAVLATEIGAQRLIICTSIDRVALGFGRPEERFLDSMTTEQAERFLAAGEFPAGSMGPKVQAAIRFLGAGGEEAVITSIEQVGASLDGRAGTRLTRHRNYVAIGQ